MWNCLSKSLKGILEKNRRKCWNIPATKVTQRCDNCILRLSPALVERLNRYYGYYKSCYGENSSKEKQQKDRKAKKGFSLDGLQFNWLDTVRNWGIIVVGLYFIQPYAPRKFIFPTDLQTDYLSKSTKYLGDNITNEVPPSAAYILSSIKGKISKAEAASDNETASSHDKVQTENAEILEKAHDLVLSSVNNLLGTVCMQLGKRNEAVIYFQQAAEANNAAALFNLGICHETGVGTTQNLKKAAEFYKRASDLGHATAMFNLGMFHAHGWGGVEVSSQKAKELFKAAANLGQDDAVKFLNLGNKKPEEVLGDVMHLNQNTDNVRNDQEHSQPSTSSGSSGRSQTINARENCKQKISDNVEEVNIEEMEPNELSSTLSFFKALNLEGFIEHKKIEKLSSVDSGVLDLSSGDETNIFV